MTDRAASAPTGTTGTGTTTGTEAEAEERRVSTLELFFDLVFVFIITQLTVLLAHDLSFAQAGRVLVIFAVVFWMYGAYAYLTNQVPPDTLARRIPLILGMCGFMTCALAIPEVFGVNGVAFGLGYVLVVAVHSGLYALVHGRYVLSFAVTNLLAALCVTAAGAVHGAATEALWLAALVLQIATPIISTRIRGDYGGSRVAVTARVGDLDPAHFVERHGLLLIVAFGESVIAIGAGAEGRHLDWSLFGGLALALALSTALWWTYFARDEDAAEKAIRQTSGAARFQLTLRAYYYSFVPMLVGVAILAAGVKTSIGQMPEALSTPSAVALAGGVALFLAGNVAFHGVLGISPLRYRVVAIFAALATIALGVEVAAVAEFFGLVVVLVVMLLVETRAIARTRSGLAIETLGDVG